MDVNHYFSADVLTSGTGDLSTVDGLTQSQQRILRRLLTNPGDYLWHSDYGAGVGRYVGATDNELVKLKAVIISQMMLEDSVAKNPLPVITFKTDKTSLTCSIQYTDADSRTLQTLAFTVGE